MFMNFLSFLLWPVYPNQAIKTIKTNWPKIHFHNLASLAYSWPHQITIKVTHRQVSACPKSFLITLKTDTQLYLKQTKLVCQRLALLGCFPICNIFPIIDQTKQVFFPSVIGPDILINVLKDCIFLIWAAWVLLNFYLK